MDKSCDPTSLYHTKLAATTQHSSRASNSCRTSCPKSFLSDKTIRTRLTRRLTFRLNSKERSHVTLKVFDARGREVKELVNGRWGTGKFIADFDASAHRYRNLLLSDNSIGRIHSQDVYGRRRKMMVHQMKRISLLHNVLLFFCN